MLLTAEILQAAGGCTRGNALCWAQPLSEACALYEIDTPARLSAFLAQVGHESGGFIRTVENLNYSAEGLLKTWPSRFTPASAAAVAHHPGLIAGVVYNGRLGNKDPGDGYRFRGRGLLQVTGRANYEAVVELLRERLANVPDFGALPDILSEPKWAAYSAAAFWADHGLNALADIGAFDKITQRINGGSTGAADRRARYERARGALA
jgi:putative chitinase